MNLESLHGIKILFIFPIKPVFLLKLIFFLSLSLLFWFAIGLSLYTVGNQNQHIK